MAGPCTCQSLCWSLSNIGKDKLAGTASTNDNEASAGSSNMVSALTFTLALFLTLAAALAVAFAFVKATAKYTDKDL